MPRRGLNVLLFSMVLCAANGISAHACENKEKRAKASPPCSSRLSCSADVVDEGIVLGPKHLSPADIERYLRADGIAQLAIIWRKLGLETNSANSWEGPCAFRTSRIPFETPGHNTGLILRIEAPADYYAYLLFLRPAGVRGGQGSHEWKLLGRVESDNQKYEPPRVRVVTSGGLAWLVVREHWGGGTGVSLSGERWHEVSDGMREVLSYPVKGHDFNSCSSPAREFRSSARVQASPGRPTRIRTDLSVAYSACDSGDHDDYTHLFTRKQKAVYEWDSASHRFVFDPNHSGISEKELGNVYSYDSLTDQEFLRYNWVELQKLARYGSRRQRQWLEEYAAGVPRSAEAKRLTELVR